MALSKLENQVKNVDADIFSVRFACDLSECKGACCTFPGGLGAPVSADETAVLTRAFETLRDRLPKEHVGTVDRFGLFEHHGNNIFLRCYNQRACVFVAYEGGIAKCSIERAFRNGEIDWIKPRSCHLFPLRYDPANGGRLRYEEFSECRPALRRGEALKTQLTEFTREAVSRIFGENFADFLINHTMELGRDGSSR